MKKLFTLCFAIGCMGLLWLQHCQSQPQGRIPTIIGPPANSNVKCKFTMTGTSTNSPVIYISCGGLLYGPYTPGPHDVWDPMTGNWMITIKFCDSYEPPFPGVGIPSGSTFEVTLFDGNQSTTRWYRTSEFCPGCSVFPANVVAESAKLVHTQEPPR